MTTQIPYGPVGAEYPQFAAGHAQYPPAEHLEQYRPAATQYGVVAQGGPVDEAPSGYPGQADYDALSAASSTYAEPPGYAEPADYASPAGYAVPPSYAAPAGYGAQTPTYPPPAAYPTAPPWAPPSPAPETPEPVVPVAAPHVGGLLVPYPEEMQKAPRAQAPALWPVAVFTFLFGVLGAISAARRADQARRGRNGTAPYWVTFVAMLVVSSFFWIVTGFAVGVPAYLEVREGATVKVLQENVVSDGQLAKANISATDADCRAAGDRRPDGTRDYLCQLTLSDGRTGQVMVTADEHGDWKPLTGR
ncbi:hypothetical protein COUCH_31025 [Couchioplanes caeruleus]|uniref:hypothetical protein n=1 Tax=Couchioplanes caeruleus TaxID=56438 RepID=UPI0020C11C81|nr:hypothetical protein [Couchioplanes caeruleus]UQU63409.1 hypothetical protein COUCH_31025 [Couchioplanes caeruleus]